MRYVVLHYHLFKNAGTSVDAVLQRNLPWETAEFPASGTDNSALVSDWIREKEHASAFSSHTAIGPLPEIPGVGIIPVLFLRDPVARIASAYRFERKQQAETWGTELARKHDLAGYVEARLARPSDRQCRNFQTSRLAAFCPGIDDEREAAIAALHKIGETGFVGLVERFDESMQHLGRLLARPFPGFMTSNVHKNVTSEQSAPLTPELDARLREVNADDLALLEEARRLFAERPEVS